MANAAKKQSAAMKVLADLVGGTGALGDVTKKQLALLSGLDVTTLHYDDATLKKLGLTTETLSATGFKDLKKSLMSASAGGISRAELKTFLTGARGTLKTEAKARQQAKIDAQLLKLQSQLPGVGDVSVRGMLFNTMAAAEARRRVTAATGVRGGIATSLRGDLNYGRNLSRATVLGA
jgi:hypothetical protein